MRLVFAGTPEFAAASLQRLIDDEHFEIVAVVSQPDRPAGRKMQLTPSPVKTLALAHGLQVFTPETVNTDEFRALVLFFRERGFQYVRIDANGPTIPELPTFDW